MALLETDYFITTWKTTTANESITIPVNTGQYTYDYDVDWGDNNGAFEIGFTGEATHTYATPGEYTVKIKGVFSHLFFNDKGDKEKIISIEQWGSIVWLSMGNMFYGCKNLIVNAIDHPNLSRVVNMSNMFNGAANFNGSIGNWDVSNVNSMQAVFFGAISFNQPIGDWDVSNVYHMTNMFYNASTFNQSIEGWNVGNVVDMQAMFFGASNFNQPLNDWDVSNVRAMRSMFHKATNFNQPIGNWNISRVTVTANMFAEANAFNQSIGSWNMNNVTNMVGMFSGASNFNQPIEGWNVGKVISMGSMFFGASSFNQSIGGWDVSGITNMSRMFYKASSFNQPIGSWDVSGVTNMSHMFSRASSFNQPIGGWDVEKVVDMTGMFSQAIAFNQPLGNWNVSNVTNMGRLFKFATNFSKSIANWNVGKVTNMREMLMGTNLGVIDLSNWDVSNVTNMHAMFAGSNFNGSIGNWDVSNVNSMQAMFSQTVAFNQPIGNWNVSNVTDMTGMFSQAVAFNQLIGNWDVSSVTNMTNMFNSSVFDLPISNWNIKNVYTMFGMFRDAKLSTANYDATLIAWSTQKRRNIRFDGGNSNYCSGESAREILVNNFGWRIDDAGKLCPTFDLLQSTITASPNSITANGIEQATITVQLKDETGDNIVTGGETVVILTTSGNITEITDNGDGSYTALLSATEVGSTIVSFTVNGSTASDTESVEFIEIDNSSFITKWKTTTENESITIPVHTNGPYTYDYDVDWGDGSNTFEVGFTGNATHTYNTPGEYIIKIRGILPHLRFYRSEDREKIIEIKQWGTNSWKSMNRMFYECTNLVGSAIDIPDLSEVSNMGEMFSRARNFNQAIGDWDVSKVTDMRGVFFGASSFNQPLGDWDVSKVTNMRSMFSGASSFNQPLGNWDVSKVTNISGMFSSAKNFNQTIENWDVSNVTNTSNMFYNTDSFDQPLGNWDVSNVINMQTMFSDTISFNQFIGDWDVSKVTNMSYMFRQARNFNQPLGNWDVSNVTNMKYMFSDANIFNQAVGDWNVSKVTDMANMFSRASAFNQVIGDWDVSKVTTMLKMFSGAFRFNQDLKSWKVIEVINMKEMFSRARTFNQAIGDWDISKVVDMTGMFYKAKLSTTNYDATLIGWSTQLLQQNVNFDGGNSNYCRAEVARTNLINTFNWQITDAGKLCPTFDLLESTITASPNGITADGIEQATITVQLKDELGDNIVTGGETVTILTVSGNLTEVTDNGNGSYTALLSATEIGATIVSFTVNGSTASNTAAVKFKAIELPVFDLLQSTITANPTSIKANNSSISIITVVLKDEEGVVINFPTGYDVIIETNLGNTSTTINNNNGTYTANLKSRIGGTAIVSFKVNGEISPNIAEVVLEPMVFELTNSTKLQSTNLYVQAAGSTGNDGSTSGIHLRWLLKGNLGDTHLPKGNNAKTKYNFNKSDDFVRIYRAEYIPQYAILDFQTLSPSVIDHSNYLWIYRVKGVQFYVYFKNKIQYNTVKGRIDPLIKGYDFIKNYGNEIIEIDHKATLSFAVTIKAVTNSTNIKTEVLSVENNTLTAAQYVTARKEFVGEGRIEEENIRRIRYKANHIQQIQFELYADTLSFNTDEKNWLFIGEYALTLDDDEIENRLESTKNPNSIHGKWPRFNDGETVNKENYIDRWNGEETEAYGTKYYENYDRRLKTVVKRYLELSDENPNNPTAMEGIPFSASNTSLPEGVTSQEEDTQDISNLTMIQLASMDYHLARMLGLGHIDTDIDLNEKRKKYVYLAEYKTVNNRQKDESTEEIQHVFLSLPTAMVDERLPIPVDLLEPVFGTNNSTNENINKLLDEEGYLFDGKQRFISLLNEELPENETNIGFFENRTQFNTSETTSPVYIGLEYKLFDPLNPDALSWRKPELSNTSKYKNFTTSLNTTSVNNETVPILIPEPDETLFLHREREEGWHRYSSYGINWFSRSKMSTVFWDVETRFKPQNRLLPPSNIKACLIVEESPLMLTSSEEQDLLKEITNDDKTLVRFTFDHNINQDKITYQINEDSMGTFTDPLDENAIFRDDKEVFADKINIFFRNKTPQTVGGKIKSIDSHTNNALAIIRTEAYELVSTGDKIIPKISPNELSNFIGSIFMFNNTKYIIHEVASSTVFDEGPIFTVYKELVSKAMLTGTEPDPTKSLDLPIINNITKFDTVENMLTESNWKVGASATTNKLGFQITIGDNWPVHREVIDEESISGVPEQIVEKSRGIWETAIIEEWHRPQENIYDVNGALVAEPKHVGMYKITFPNSLDHHAQFNSHNVDWYQGIVRIHTQNNPTKQRKILEVVKIENIGTSNPLVVFAIDPQYPVNVTDMGDVADFDPISIGNQEVNFYPGYRVYLYHDEVHHLTETAISPDTGEGLKYSILGLQSVDPDYPENTANSNEWYRSKISQPGLFFAQEIIRPKTPLLSNGEEFVYATRPDTFGKSTFSLTPGFSHIPHGVQFYRSNDDAILNALYKPSTVLEIKEKLKEDFDPKFHLVKRWQNLLEFNFEYTETFQTDNEFFLYPEDETGYRFPNPDKYELYESINNILEYRNENYKTNYSLLSLGDRNDDTNNGVIGTINLTDIVIPKLESEDIDNDVTFKDYIKSVIHNAFTALTEIPLMYEYIKPSDYQPIAKKQVIRDETGGLLPPTSPKFDMAPMAKRMSAQLTNEITGAKTRVLFTDFNLDGTSNNLYFYAIREMGSTMQLGNYSPVLGPIKLVNTRPPQNPDIKRILPVLENVNLGIKPGVSIEMNAYPKIQNVNKIKLYRTLNPNKALSVRTMDLVKTIDLEEDKQIINNIWKLKDEFIDLNYVPYGDPLYYRVTALREIEYADGSNTVKENHSQITEYVPSESSKLLISSIIENGNPESPVLEYNFDLDSSDNSLIHNTILKWDKKVHNGKYHVYKMNAQGNWIKIYALNSNLEEIQLLLVDTSLDKGTLSLKSETENLKYHHFKVISENSAGMMSTEERILTIPNINNIATEEGIGSMIIENTNIVR